MKIKEIEREELKERIMRIKYRFLYRKAELIWAKEVDFENWNRIKRFFFVINCLTVGGIYNPRIKQIQMRLLEEEVDEAVKGER